MQQNAANCGWFRGALSGLLSGACLFLPFAAYLWAPGLLFGILVASHAAKISGAGRLRTLLAFLTSAAIYPLAFVTQALAGLEGTWNYLAGCVIAGGAGAAAITFWVYHWFENRGFLKWIRVSLVGAAFGGIVGALMVYLPNDLTTWKIKVVSAFVLWQTALSAQYRFQRRRSTYGSTGFIQLRPSGVHALLFGLIAWMHHGDAAAPKIQRSAPVNGARNVPATLDEIMVEFDQPIQRGSLRFTGRSAWFPPAVGEVQVSEDGRRYTLGVQLESNREYVLGLSGALNASGELQEPTVLSFSTPFKDPSHTPNALDESKNKLSFFRLRALIDESYAYRDRLDIDWATRFRAFETRLLTAKTPRAFAHTVIELLEVAQDPHLSVEVAGSRMTTWQAPFTPNYSIPATREALAQWTDHGPSVSTGVTESGIGYFRLASLNPARAIDLFRGLSLIPQLFEGPGIIIDIRENNGGAEHLAKAFAGMFVDTPVPYAQSIYRDENDPNQLTSPVVRTLYPTPYAPRFSGSVATLSGRRVMSSAESLLLMLKQIPKGRVFGDTTRGSSGNPKKRALGNDVAVHLPSWIATDAQGTPIEGVGIAPDETVATRPEDFESKDDPVLDTALGWLVTQP